MAEFNQKQYLDLTGLSLYDDKIKAHIKANDDALTTSIGNVASDLVDEAATARAAELAINNKIGTVAEGKTVVGMIEDLAGNAEEGVNGLADRLDAIEDESTGILATAKAYTDAEVLKVNNAVGVVQEVIGNTDNLGAATVIDSINANTDAIAAEVERAKKAEEANAKAIAEEIARAKAAEEANAAAAAAAQADIDAFMASAEVGEAAVDTLKEIQAYIESDGAAAAQMTKDIAANATAIANETTRATGVEAGLAERIADLETAVGEGGSVGTQIDAKIAELDSTAAHAAGADGLALNVAIVDGKLTSISGSIAANVYDAHGAAATAQTAAAGDATTKANTAEANAKAHADAELAKVYAAVQPIANSDIEALFA